MQKIKITQQDEANALESYIRFSPRNKCYAIKFSSLSQFLDESPLEFEETVDMIAGILTNIFFEDYEIDYSSFNDWKKHFETFAKDDLTGLYEGISITAQQVRTILSSSTVSDWDKEVIFSASKLCNILDENETVQIFENFLFKDPQFDQEQKLSFAADSLFLNFNLLTQDMYESLMSNYEISNSYGYSDLLLSSAACPRTKDWVKKEYFSNIFENIALEWFDFDNEQLLLLEEAQYDLFGE